MVADTRPSPNEAYRGCSAVRHPITRLTNSSRRDAVRAPAPVDDLGFVDFIARVVRGGQARRLADGTLDIDHPVARSTDEMVVVVAHSVLVARWRPGRLDAADDAFVGEGRKAVVHRLKRDRTNVGPHDGVDVGRGAVRSLRHRPQDSQTLRRDLHTMPAQEGDVVNRCPRRRPGS